MIPKKIRRTIVVNKETWEYCITGRFCAGVFLHNLNTNERMEWHVEGEGSIKPSDIRILIEERELYGIKAKKYLTSR